MADALAAHPSRKWLWCGRGALTRLRVSRRAVHKTLNFSMWVLVSKTVFTVGFCLVYSWFGGDPYIVPIGVTGLDSLRDQEDDQEDDCAP